MSSELENQGPRKQVPTPEYLAGVPVTVEGCEDLIVRPRRKGAAVAIPTRDENDKPTVDDLAGIPVTVEGKEDLSVRPRRRGSPQQDQSK
jgi:hypothetical protein